MKKLTITALIMLIVICALTGGVQAYQSISTGAPYSTYASYWISYVRSMEQPGQGLGLNASDATYSANEANPNNIDVHMLKNTEYGAIVLLGASDYGKQGADITARKMDAGEVTGTGVQASTTGNRYGIYELGYHIDAEGNVTTTDTGEYVSGALASTLKETLPKYINRYTDSSSSRKVGDATDIYHWHDSNSGKFWSSTYFKTKYFFVRGQKGAFGYDLQNGVYEYVSGTGATGDKNYVRAAVVVGEGL